MRKLAALPPNLIPSLLMGEEIKLTDTERDGDAPKTLPFKVLLLQLKDFLQPAAVAFLPREGGGEPDPSDLFGEFNPNHPAGKD